VLLLIVLAWLTHSSSSFVGCWGAGGWSLYGPDSGGTVGSKADYDDELYIDGPRVSEVLLLAAIFVPVVGSVTRG
jgi:hypothetical protein